MISKPLILSITLSLSITFFAQKTKNSIPKDGWHLVETKISTTYPLRVDRLNLWARIDNGEITILSEFKTNNPLDPNNILLDENRLNHPYLKKVTKRKDNVFWKAEFKVLNNQRNVKRRVRYGPNSLGGGSKYSKLTYIKYVITFR